LKKTSKRNQIREIAEELDIFDEMFSTLIELLEKKGVISQNEFEARLKAKIEKAKGKKSYREVQFSE